jgi:hypothetical protein
VFSFLGLYSCLNHTVAELYTIYEYSRSYNTVYTVYIQYLHCIINTYKEPSIISGTGAAIWSKPNFGLTGHRHPRSIPLPSVCTVPSTSAILKCILEIVFCEDIQHRLRFCLDYIVSKWRPFSFIFNQGNRKVGWLGNDSHVVFGKKKNPGEKGSVRRRVVVMQ